MAEGNIVDTCCAGALTLQAAHRSAHLAEKLWPGGSTGPAVLLLAAQMSPKKLAAACASPRRPGTVVGLAVVFSRPWSDK